MRTFASVIALCGLALCAALPVQASHVVRVRQVVVAPVVGHAQVAQVVTPSYAQAVVQPVVQTVTTDACAVQPVVGNVGNVVNSAYTSSALAVTTPIVTRNVVLRQRLFTPRVFVGNRFLRAPFVRLRF